MESLPNHILYATLCAIPSSVYLHRFGSRGDTAVVSILSFAVLLVIYHILQGLSLVHALSHSVIAICAHGLAIVLLTVAYRLSPLPPLSSFPGPFINRITSLRLAHTVYTGKRHRVIEDLHHRYGPSYAPARILYPSMTLLPSIQSTQVLKLWIKVLHIGQVASTRVAYSLCVTELSMVLGGGSGQVHSPRHHIVIKRTRQLIGHISDEAQGKSHVPVDLTHWIRLWAYDVMGDLTFGGSSRIELMSDGDEQGLVKSGQQATISFEVLGEVPSLFDILWYLPVTKEVHALDRLAEHLMTIKGNDSADDDIASYLLGRHETDHESLGQGDLNLDALFAIQAGSDTTSGVLTLLIYHILCHRTVYERVVAELSACYPSPSSLDDRVYTLPYLAAVVNEGIRLGTPFPGLPRVVPEGGSVLAGRFVPAGTIVGVPAYTQQVSPENFLPAPKDFIPERWLPGGLGPGSIHRPSALMAFSYGPFGCLGKTIAIRELQMMTAHLLLSFDVRLADSFSRAQFERGISNMRSTIFEYPLLVEVQPRV